MSSMKKRAFSDEKILLLKPRTCFGFLTDKTKDNPLNYKSL